MGARLFDDDEKTVRVPPSSRSWREEPSVPYAMGEVVGDRYRLVEELGRGGMGAVWLAIDDEGGGAEVAVKLMARGAGGEASARLLQEASAAARIGHPSIVRVLDVGMTPTGEPFLVMARLRGESLRRALDARGRLPATQAVQILLPIASALAAAHEAGIVHRDLKPDNIVLAETAAGIRPTLVDFGVAKLRANDEHLRVITVKGVAVGSPDYMAPEQIKTSVEVDERADVWALCVVLYEAVTGQRPFADATYVGLLNQILTVDPRPITGFAAGDAALWAIVEKGLSKAPEARHRSMLELGEALARWAVHHGLELDAAGQSIRGRWLQVRSDRSSTPAIVPTLQGLPSLGSADATGDQPASPSMFPEAPSASSTSSPTLSRPRSPGEPLFGPATIAVLVACALLGLLLGAVLPRLLLPAAPGPGEGPAASGLGTAEEPLISASFALR